MTPISQTMDKGNLTGEKLKYTYQKQPAITMQDVSGPLLSKRITTLREQRSALTQDHQLIQWDKTMQFVDIRINPALLIGLIIIGLLLILLTDIHKKESVSFCESASTASDTMTTPVSADMDLNEEASLDYPFSERGFVFETIDRDYLTREYILTQTSGWNISQQDLLRLAINGVYSKYGRKFEDTSSYSGTHFAAYDWYQETPRRTDVSFLDFNDAETHNVNLLVRIEQELGFR